MREYLFPIKLNDIKSHPTIVATLDDDIRIIYKVFDNFGEDADLSGFTGIFRAAYKNSKTNLFQKTAGFSGNKIIIDIASGDFDVKGNYKGQLRLTQSGHSYVAVDSRITIKELIE